MITLLQFNEMKTTTAQKMISRCCASARWAERMAASRPYHSITQLTETADAHWRELEERDFLEAFRGHPKIGRPDSSGDAHGDGDEPDSPRAMAAKEQSAVARASGRVRASLDAHNRDYEEKFGFIFIVCASGKSAGEMLRLLRARMGNTRAQEIANAAEEQRKITRLRIAKLFAPT